MTLLADEALVELVEKFIGLMDFVRVIYLLTR